MVEKEVMDGFFHSHSKHIRKQEIKNILFMVDVNGRITHVNDHWAAVLGHKKENIVGKHVLQLTHVEDMEKFLKAVRKVAQKGKKSHKVNHRVRHSSGNWKKLQTKATAVKDHTGKTLGVMGVSQEIKTKRAETGIAILILFIATILVSAITSGILIKTSSTLQSKAIIAGDRSASQVSAGFQTATLTATDGSDKSVEYFDHRVKIAASGEPINLEQVSITIDITNASANLVYANGTCSRNVSGGFYTNSTSETGVFTVEYLARGPTYAEGFLQTGDLVKLCYEAPREIQPAEAVRIRMIPQIGNVHDLQILVPEILATQRVIFI